MGEEGVAVDQHRSEPCRPGALIVLQRRVADVQGSLRLHLQPRHGAKEDLGRRLFHPFDRRHRDHVKGPGQVEPIQDLGQPLVPVGDYCE